MNMFTFLDLLVVVFMVLAALGLMAVCLMFLVRKPIVRKVCFYMTVALSVFAAYAGMRIGGSLFPTQTAVAVIAGLAGIAALVFERLSKGDEKKFLFSRILSAAALVVGMVNAFMF